MLTKIHDNKENWSTEQNRIINEIKCQTPCQALWIWTRWYFLTDSASISIFPIKLLKNWVTETVSFKEHKWLVLHFFVVPHMVL